MKRFNNIKDANKDFQKENFPVKEYIKRMALISLVFSFVAGVIGMFIEGFIGLTMERAVFIVSNYNFFGGAIVNIIGGLVLAVAMHIQRKHARLNRELEVLEDKAYKERLIGKSLLIAGTAMIVISMLVTIFI